MQVAVDTFDRATAYADLRDDERLTDELRARAFRRARKLGAQRVEFWRPPYGCGADRMSGFVERAAVPPESQCEPADNSSTMRGADAMNTKQKLRLTAFERNRPDAWNQGASNEADEAS